MDKSSKRRFGNWCTDLAMSWGGGKEEEEAGSGPGGGGWERVAKMYRGVPSREEIPGVEDLETLWELRGDTAAGGNIR